MTQFIYEHIYLSFDYVLVSIYTLICGIFLCLLLENTFPKFDENYTKKYSVPLILLDIVVNVMIIRIFARYVEVLTTNIPFYFDNDPLYKNFRVTKFKTNIFLAFSLLTFYPSFKNKIIYITDILLKMF